MSSRAGIQIQVWLALRPIVGTWHCSASPAEQIVYGSSTLWIYRKAIVSSYTLKGGNVKMCELYLRAIIKKLKKRGEKKKRESQKHKALMNPTMQKPLSKCSVLYPSDPGPPLSWFTYLTLISILWYPVFLKLEYEHYYIFKHLFSPYSSFSPFSH